MVCNIALTEGGVAAEGIAAYRNKPTMTNNKHKHQCGNTISRIR